MFRLTCDCCCSTQWKFPLTMVRAGVQWFLTSTGPAASSHLETGAFVRSRPDVTFPDIQLHFLPSVIIDHGQKMGDFHAFQACLVFVVTRNCSSTSDFVYSYRLFCSVVCLSFVYHCSQFYLCTHFPSPR